MKIFRVKVYKSKLPTYWYANKIGKEFLCEPTSSWNDDLFLRVIFEGEYDGSRVPCYLNMTDVDILEEFDGKIVETVNVKVVRNESK